MSIGHKLRQTWGVFWRRSRLVNGEPLNWVSLTVIILVDIFILINVFSGLSEIGNWPLSPTAAQPCYEPWQSYRQDRGSDRAIRFLKQQITLEPSPQGYLEQLEESTKGKLGPLSSICLTYAKYQDAVNRPPNQARLRQQQEKQAQIQALEATNARIRQEYGSTLLEQLAGQPPEQSINFVEAAKAKATLEANNRQIAALKNEIAALEQAILQEPSSQAFLNFLEDTTQFAQLEGEYRRSQFWYPSRQLLLQVLFLLPLMGIALWLYRFGDRHHYDLLALMSWHLLVILLIPLVLKILEWLQIGTLFTWLANGIVALFGGLLFLVRYVYILLVPAIGLGMIKVAQVLFLNPQRQAAGRIQKQRCVRCGKRLRDLDQHCPHCGYLQWMPCPSCGQPTYRHLPYCRHCGALIPPKS
ncbi:zinc ribbon domain-containing protein [Thermosynechococcus vestitus]|uniref:Tlr1997 protein n=1 Tax=Thermosynechococcus vestitus (strain NIES-2133 / IAM M-273 / BP-1) TaxID=197221 RepID=Q8DHG2_THEVB|nr:zinc ribbon domain-containing protein [Thermosynechococcus vestitus]BAC09549.1 tlr1997 [Thermosynechococcus vestitus BP-1]